MASMGIYASKRTHLQRGFIFRGQADATWPLRTTLDRYTDPLFIPDRKAVSAQLLDAFLKESRGLLSGTEALYDDHSATEFLARHHGLPTAIMDWTESPYIAAYFAMADVIHEKEQAPKDVTVWALDLSTKDHLDDSKAMIFSELVEVILPRSMAVDNERAFEQQSVFLRITDDEPKLETELGIYLRRFDIPASERLDALQQLDQMGINHRRLFRSLDAAAQTSQWRVSCIEGILR